MRTGGNITLNAGLTTTNTTTGNITLTGNVSGAGNIAVASGLTLNLNQTGSSLYSGCISGSSSQLQLLGNGSLTFTGVSTYTGATTINNGTLTLGNSSSLGTLATSSLLNNGTLIYDSNQDQTIGYNISGTGALRVVGESRTVLGAYLTTSAQQVATNATVADVLSRIALSTTGGANIISGNAGIFDVSYNSTANTGTFQAQIYDGTYTKFIFVKLAQSGSNVTAVAYQGDGTNCTGYLLGSSLGSDFTKTSFTGSLGLATNSAANGYGLSSLSMASKTIFTGTNTYSGATTIANTSVSITGGTAYVNGVMQIGNGSTSGSMSSAQITNNGILIFNRSDAVSYAGNISGAGSLTQNGSGSVSLTGINTYTGNTNVNCGTLSVDAGTFGGSNSYGANLSIASGANFIWNGSANETLSCISGAGTFNASSSSGALIINGTQLFSGAYNFAQTVNITGGSNSGASGLGNANAININNGGIVNLTGGANSFMGYTVNATSTLLTINAGGLLAANQSSGSYAFHLGRINMNGGTIAGASTSTNGLFNLDQTINVTANSNITATNMSTTMTGGTVFNISSGATLNISGTLINASASNDNGLVLKGAGTLLLTGSNSYAGTTNITSGTLQVGNGSTTGTLGTGNISVNNGTLAFNYSAGSYTIGNTSSTAYITLNNATVNVSSGNVTLAGYSSTSGTAVGASTMNTAVNLSGK